MELTNRKKRILRAIVEIYIITAEPVGSKAVAKQAGLYISTATISPWATGCMSMS